MLVTPEEFVGAVQELVVEAAAEDELSVLRKPPGRAPWPAHVARSEWFNGLTPRDQQMVAEVALAATFSAAFAFCAILDGVRAFDAERGSLRLSYIGPDGVETLLNDPGRCELHAQLRGDGPPP